MLYIESGWKKTVDLPVCDANAPSTHDVLISSSPNKCVRRTPYVLDVAVCYESSAQTFFDRAKWKSMATCACFAWQRGRVTAVLLQGSRRRRSRILRSKASVQSTPPSSGPDTSELTICASLLKHTHAMFQSVVH